MQVIDDEEALKNIAENVAKFRGERSRYWLAKQVGVRTNAISGIEDREHMPGAGLVARIAYALGVKVDDLIHATQKNNRMAS